MHYPLHESVDKQHNLVSIFYYFVINILVNYDYYS